MIAEIGDMCAEWVEWAEDDDDHPEWRRADDLLTGGEASHRVTQEILC
jgi:hypothetical protein